MNISVFNPDKRTLMLVVGAAVLILGMFFVANKFISDEDSEITTNLISGSDDQSSQSETSNDLSEVGEKTGSRGPETGSNSGSAPIQPYGDFISHHHPNLDGKPVSNVLASACNTSPNASCVIRFIKDSIVKELPKKQVDSNGNVEWNWKLQDLGLTEGSWKVQAFAELNSKSAQTDDALMLEVGP